MKKFEKEFRQDHPETIGETDKEFDNANYTEWLENKLSQPSKEQPSEWLSEDKVLEILENYFRPGMYDKKVVAEKICQLSISQQHGEYQICPKCNGQGSVSKPPFVAGDVHRWDSTSTSFTCDVCNGAKIIVRPLQQPEGAKEEAIAFAEWNQVNKFEYSPVTRRWFTNYIYSQKDKFYTTSELFTLYKQETKNQNK